MIPTVLLSALARALAAGNSTATADGWTVTLAAGRIEATGPGHIVRVALDALGPEADIVRAVLVVRAWTRAAGDHARRELWRAAVGMES